MKIYTVQIRETSKTDNVDITRVRALSVYDALTRALTKLYGRTASFQRNNGLDHGFYGQIWSHGSLGNSVKITIS